jgi:hypothetical protein
VVSRKLDILQALTAQLQTITPDNGYDYDLSSSVFRGRSVFGAADVVPFLSILESPRPLPEIAAEESKLRRLNAWALLLQGWAVDDKQNPLDPVYGLMAATEQCLSQVASVRTSNGLAEYPDVYRLGGRITSISIGPGFCRPAADVSAFSYFYIPLTLQFNEDVSNPWVEGSN